MAADGIKPEQITRVIVSHFHRTCLRLMKQGHRQHTMSPTPWFYVPRNEFKLWMDGDLPNLPKGARPWAPKRCSDVPAPRKDKLKQYEWETESIQGSLDAAPGHTPGHTASMRRKATSSRW